MARDVQDEMHAAKVAALSDMIRRAVAQADWGKALRQVSEAIAMDWSPLMRVDAKGAITAEPRDPRKNVAG